MCADCRLGMIILSLSLSHPLCRFSFPCMCVGGEWIVKEGLKLSSFAREKIQATEKELFQEFSDASAILTGGSKL